MIRQVSTLLYGGVKIENLVVPKKLKNVARDHQGQAAGWPEGIGASPQGRKTPFLLRGGGPASGLSYFWENLSLPFLLSCYIIINRCPVLFAASPPGGRDTLFAFFVF